ncbi:protein RTM1 [Penicillium diatomitis]|uniref:Protein RTM1 n=1 Tax=Penicillium diatomitis TaxID=2819901 RepID=A0A9W9XHV0_9EURO|nr:protein RTM1 [Penicillium diatomitis]KAJ5492815.1 protein RTM1 [Penicillium diatomitis]
MSSGPVDYRTAIWAYPSEAVAILFTIFFATTTFIHLYQLIRHRTWLFISFLIGGFCEFSTLPDVLKEVWFSQVLTDL